MQCHFSPLHTSPILDSTQNSFPGHTDLYIQISIPRAILAYESPQESGLHHLLEDLPRRRSSVPASEAQHLITNSPVDVFYKTEELAE